MTAALDLERRDEEMGMVGETISYKEVGAAIEKVTEDVCWSKKIQTRN